ncbi:flagellar motor protein [Pelagibaculum spongiae]|uniref:Flagellar motor protein n=1 Tax=Pelagibaculum spongiae TaxID=2080658 RepID=A0A2V1GQX0_9GAMM|nr:flagellar motor protein [Pelagibaculum spongiae]PVZ66689.1 flagellar motor protein [Pelagibaculum spongiae]
MNPLMLLGLIIGVMALGYGQYLEGGSLSALINGPALLIVLGGSFGAVLLQTPGKSVARALSLLGAALFNKQDDFNKTITRLVQLGFQTRREGLLSLENAMEREKNPYLKKMLHLLIDGVDPESIRQIMELEIIQHRASDIRASRFFESIGGYCPTFGIIGAVMGLIQVMGRLGQPEQLGSGIALAFVATVYGIVAANLIFLPLFGRIRALIDYQSCYREMLLEGVLSLSVGENPRITELRLKGFLVGAI